MNNNVRYIYETYKTFFEKNDIDFSKFVLVYNNYFGDFTFEDYDSSILSCESYFIGKNKSMNAYIRKQDAMREISAIMEYENIEQFQLLYDSNDSCYYVMLLQNGQNLVIRPLQKDSKFSFECDFKKCMVQRKEKNGLFEEEYNFSKNCVSLKYYENESLQYLTESIVLPTFMSIQEMDNQIIPKVEVSLQRGVNQYTLRRKEKGVLQFEEAMTGNYKLDIYNLFHQKLLSTDIGQIDNKKAK